MILVLEENYSLYLGYKNHIFHGITLIFNFFGEIRDNLKKEIFQKDQIYVIDLN